METRNEPLNLNESSPFEPPLNPKSESNISSEEQLRDFYTLYENSMGFGVSKLRTKNADGKQKYFSTSCTKGDIKPSRAKKKFIQLRPMTKTYCTAKINIVVRNEGEYLFTSICLEHNHTLSPNKICHIKSYKVIDGNVKRRLDTNDKAGITVAKTFQSLVVEYGGYENISFDERTCRNYVSKSRRLRLRSGDAEALTNYFLRMQTRNYNFFL